MTSQATEARSSSETMRLAGRSPPPQRLGSVTNGLGSLATDSRVPSLMALSEFPHSVISGSPNLLS
ncbi:hypothetical protein, partial [Streptomyces alanosinicus]|uniref:hypothetical protein n=1 Tax=Streptomyces alanosinicus TaxID=68171 RepID=UPI001E3DD341